MAEKLKDYKQVDGQDGREQYRNLNDILQTDTSPYRGMSFEDYEEKIRDMDIADLQVHAIDCELRPVDNRSLLIDRLLSQYRRRTSGYRDTVRQEPGLKIDESKAKMVSKILAAGK